MMANGSIEKMLSRWSRAHSKVQSKNSLAPKEALFNFSKKKEHIQSLSLTLYNPSKLLLLIVHHLLEGVLFFARRTSTADRVRRIYLLLLLLLLARHWH